MRYWIVIGLLLCGCAGAARAVDLVIATSEYPPYISTQGKPSFITDLYRQIGKQMGVNFVFRSMPWKRCLVSLDQGDVWGVVPFVRTPDREQRYLLSNTLYSRKAKFFYYDGGAQRWQDGYADLSELRQFRIGGVAGYWYEAMFISARIKLDTAISDERNFTKLRAGRFDLMLVDENVARYIIATQFGAGEVTRFQSLDSPVYKSENFMMVRRGKAEAALLARFNKALETIRRNGVYDGIVTRHKLVLNN